MRLAFLGFPRTGEMPPPPPIHLRQRHVLVLRAIADGVVVEDATYECRTSRGDRVTYEANDLCALGFASQGEWGAEGTRRWSITDAGRIHLAHEMPSWSMGASRL